MKTHTITKNNPKAENQMILVFYWFISNKHNAELFRELELLQQNYPAGILRIVGLNPFNNEEDIECYRSENALPFELEKDHKNSGLFYQVSTYPTLILMEKSGKILHRQNGFISGCLADFEAILKTYAVKDTICREIFFAPEPYRHNLSVKYKNKSI